jgi:hypothetical protein
MLPLGNDLELGRSTANGKRVMLSREERSTHLYVCGSTGTGKSKFLEHLIRQDILKSNLHKCGMLLLDPHGSLYDGIMRWMAFHGLNRPVIPIDLRDSTTAISYNVLRKRDKGDTGVTITNFVQAMAYVWGEGGTNATPLFARWAHNILRTLYESGHTLLEAEYLLDATEPDIRRKLIKNLEIRSLIRDWEYSRVLSVKDFEGEVGSTVNRLRRFLSTQKLRHMFGQDVAGKTLDLEKCLEKGYIVLVNLSTEGGWISNEDSSLFATLLLSDLWAAAQARGKRKGIRPFHVYLDEFQNFVTPTMAENLDQARGYGLHLTLAHQFPNQILHAGAHGQQVFDSIMENARSKVVFQVGTTNLEQLAKILFMGVLNPEEIKHRLYSTKVMDYRKVLLASSGKSSGRNRGSGYNERSAEAIDPEDPTLRINLDSTGTSNYEVDSDASTEGTSEAYRPLLGKELSSFAYRPLDEQLYLAMATLFEQEQRHCVVRTRDMKSPVSIVAPIVKDVPIAEERFKTYLEKMLRQTNIAHPVEEVRQQIARREKQLQKIDAPPVDEEPQSAKRKLSSSEKKRVS